MKIVCLCGSTRFYEEFRQVSVHETLVGNIVLSLGCNMLTDNDIVGPMTDDERKDIKLHLHLMQLCRIDIADEVLVVNPGGYIGEVTATAIEYARLKGKPVRFLKSYGV